MNLTKNDLKLFKILDKEIDKTLSFGCHLRCWWIITWNYWDWYFWRYDFKEINKEDYFDDELYDQDDWYFISSEVLWHYPTTNEVLRYLYNMYNYKNGKSLMSDTEKDRIHLKTFRKCIEKTTRNWKLIEEKERMENLSHFLLDITKPMQNYSEQQKEELITFLETIN